MNFNFRQYKQTHNFPSIFATISKAANDNNWSHQNPIQGAIFLSGERERLPDFIPNRFDPHNRYQGIPTADVRALRISQLLIGIQPSGASYAPNQEYGVLIVASRNVRMWYRLRTCYWPGAHGADTPRTHYAMPGTFGWAECSICGEVVGYAFKDENWEYPYGFWEAFEIHAHTAKHIGYSGFEKDKDGDRAWDPSYAPPHVKRKEDGKLYFTYPAEYLNDMRRCNRCGRYFPNDIPRNPNSYSTLLASHLTDLPDHHSYDESI